MNKDKLNLVLDLYKDGKITKEEANLLLDDPEPIIRVEPIQIPNINPFSPNPVPLGPYVSYGVGTATEQMTNGLK